MRTDISISKRMAFSGPRVSSRCFPDLDVQAVGRLDVMMPVGKARLVPL